MKRIIFYGAGLVMLVATALIGTYKLGFRAGVNDALVLETATYMGTLSALEKIRAEDLAAATTRLEHMCYSSAMVTLQTPRYASAHAVVASLPRLVEYRRKYAMVESEWTPVESELEKLLHRSL